MADNNLRNDLDDIATALEKKGRADLSAIVDLCNEQIHTRTAALKKPARVARKASTTKVEPKAVAGDALKKIRWAKTELKDLAREFRKAGSLAEARALLKCAEDLAEEEATLVQGPVVEGEEPVAAEDADVDFDIDAFFANESGEGEGEGEEASDDDVEGEDDDTDGDDEECPPCPPCPPCDDEETAEKSEALPELPTVEACVREMRSLARELRASKKPEDRKAALVLLRQAMQCEAEGEVVVVELPPTDGGSDPVDATDFDLGDDDLADLEGIATDSTDDEIISDAVLDLEGEEDDTVEGDEAAEPAAEEATETPAEEAQETTPTEYMEASAILARTAATLKKRGHEVEAQRLMAKALEFRKQARVASAEKTPLKASLTERKAAFQKALDRRKSK